MGKRIAVLGAGAIGASIGAYLIRDGRDVTLIDQWAAHIEKIRSDGLKLTDFKGEFTVPAKALHLSDVSGLREQFDIVFLSVKSYDTRWSTYLIEPHLKPTGFIISAQNSLNDEVVANVVGYSRTVGLVPSIGVAVYEPGHVIRTDPMTIHIFSVGELSGLITPRVLEIVDALKVIGHTEATTNIWGARWAKLGVNCMANALAGLVGPTIYSLSEELQDATNLIRAVTGSEAVRVAQALGITVEPIWGISAQDFIEATTKDSLRKLKTKIEEVLGRRYPVAEQMKKLGVPSRPSLLQDVLKGRRTEIDYLNGYVVKRSEEAGVSTPMNQAIVDLTKKVETGAIKPDPSNLETLKPYTAL